MWVLEGFSQQRKADPGEEEARPSEERLQQGLGTVKEALPARGRVVTGGQQTCTLAADLRAG
jgi:hypothetical protein